MKLRIYTDGACSYNPGPGGWAAILLFPTECQEISGYEANTTNNRMEVKAAVEALKLAINLGHNKIHLYSDSAYLVNAVKKEWLKKWCNNHWKTVSGQDVKNKDLWLQLLSLIESRNVEVNFIKVKGHADNEYNNRCDKLARREIERKRA